MRAHSVQFFADDAFLLDEWSRLIGARLGDGDAGVVIAAKAQRDGLAQRLKACGLDLSHAATLGRYRALDAAEMLSSFTRDGRQDAAPLAALLGGIIARATAAATGTQSRVVVLVASSWAEGNARGAIRLEQLWNDLAQTYAFSLHCAYPMSLFGQEADDQCMEQICAEHTHVIPAESYTTLATDEARLRAIALLQQKAQALKTAREERRSVEQALHERNHQLRAAIVARDEFLSAVTHELRTPITSLRAFAQLLLRDIQRKRQIAPERLEAALEALEQQTGKLNQLVAGVLDTTHVEAGKPAILPPAAHRAASASGSPTSVRLPPGTRYPVPGHEQTPP